MTKNFPERFEADRLNVEIQPSKAALGSAAAALAISRLRSALAERSRARIIVGTGPSQNEVIEALVAAQLDWSAVEVFHMDEYAGIGRGHPASFRRWLDEHLASRVHPGAVHYLEGDAPGPEAECARYAALLAAAPVDIALLGFGENGHVAFNDPHVADFADPLAVKVVEMDRRCRAQQVGEGHFPGIDAVPRFALTLTCPKLFRARTLVCSVPDRRKAEAVRNALRGPVSAACPASGVRTHPDAHLFLDWSPLRCSERDGDSRGRHHH